MVQGSIIQPGLGRKNILHLSRRRDKQMQETGGNELDAVGAVDHIRRQNICVCVWAKQHAMPWHRTCSQQKVSHGQFTFQ